MRGRIGGKGGDAPQLAPHAYRRAADGPELPSAPGGAPRRHPLGAFDGRRACEVACVTSFGLSLPAGLRFKPQPRVFLAESAPLLLLEPAGRALPAAAAPDATAEVRSASPPQRITTNCTRRFVLRPSRELFSTRGAVSP